MKWWILCVILRVRCFGKEDEEEAMLRELKEREDCLVLCCCPSSHVLLFRILDCDNLHNLFALPCVIICLQARKMRDDQVRTERKAKLQCI